MSSWKLAPSLAALFAEINTTWPTRDRSSDGTIGDQSHMSRDSQHNRNTNPTDDVPDGMVTAIDIDKDGIDVKHVLNRLIGEARVWYVIHDRKIYSRTYGWTARSYEGSNPHTGHIHVSLVQSKWACEETGPWGIYAKPVKPETALARALRIAAQRLRKIRNLRGRLHRN